jgi:hypothetical protein
LQDDQSVFNNTVVWTPPTDEIDIGVPEAGIHQLSWEQTKDNPTLNPASTKLEGFSPSFNIEALSSSTSSSLTSTSSSSISNSASPHSASSSSGTNHVTVLGLGIGFGILLLICIIGGLFGFRLYQIRKQRLSRTQDNERGEIPVWPPSGEIGEMPMPMGPQSVGAENGKSPYQPNKVLSA